jgi:superfamily I DNA/RNA helicase
MKNKKGSHAEEIVWNSVKKVFNDRDCLGYLNYPIFSGDFQGRKEPDILLLDKELGVIVIEVKGLKIDNISNISGHKWVYNNFYVGEGNPYQQAEQQLFGLVDWLNENEQLKNQYSKRVMVALPYITQSEWHDKGFHLMPSNPPILFKDDLEDATILHKLESSYLFKTEGKLDEERWQTMTSLVSGWNTKEVPKMVTGPRYSLLYIAASLERLNNDLPMIISLLDKGKKVIILSSVKREQFILPSETIQKFEDAFLFQYITTDCSYFIDEPIMVIDGFGVDESFELEWFDRFPNFNKGQYKVEHAPIDVNLSISAGAGTGKTTVMIQRIMFLLAMVDQIRLKDIVMITFTRESAQEMKHRLKQELMLRYKVTRQTSYLTFAEELRESNISTIHSFAKSLIQELGFILGFGRNVKLKGYKIKRREIIEQKLNDFVNGRSIDTLGLHSFRHYELVRIIETYWDEMERKGLNQEQISALKWHDSEVLVKKSKGLNALFTYIFPSCEEEFSRLKNLENAITIGDLVRKISEISSSKPDTLKELPYTFKYLFVDEFQDSDDVQIKLVSQINRMIGSCLFVVGDVKQSIYRFRGADYTAFEQLKKNVDEAFIDEPLRINYRTSKTLLKKVDNYFYAWSRNDELKYSDEDKLLGIKPSTYGMNEFRIVKYNKWADELQSKVIDEIKKSQELIRSQTHKSKKKIALLVRTNKQAKRLYDWCQNHSISAEMNVGGTFFKSEAVKDFHTLLGALLYPHDSKSVLNALATPFFKAEVLIDDLVKYHGENDKILNYLRREHNLSEDFEQKVDSIRIKPGFAVIRDFMNESYLQNLFSKKLAAFCEPPSEYQKNNVKIEVLNYQKNINHLMNLLHQTFDSTNSTLYSLYSWLGINIKTNREEDEPKLVGMGSEDVVEIVTVHKSKGLEYHTVIMPFTDQPFEYERDEILFDDDKKRVGWYVKRFNVENDFYNQLNTVESEEIVKEETRLLYVAMTRSRERLVIFQPKKTLDQTWSMQLDKLSNERGY